MTEQATQAKCWCWMTQGTAKETRPTIACPRHGEPETIRLWEIDREHPERAALWGRSAFPAEPNERIAQPRSETVGVPSMQKLVEMFNAYEQALMVEGDYWSGQERAQHELARGLARTLSTRDAALRALVQQWREKAEQSIETGYYARQDKSETYDRCADALATLLGDTK